MKKLITLLFVLVSVLGYSQSPKDTIGGDGINVHLLDSLVEVYVNQERADRGIQPLIINEERKEHSYNHSQWMMDNNKFEHSESVSECCLMAGIWGGLTYEEAAKMIVKSWFDSPPHRAALLDTYYKYGGCGTAYELDEDGFVADFYDIKSSFGISRHQ